MPHQRIPRNTTTKKNHGALRLPTTYANRKNDNEIFAAWHSYVGRWISRDKFGQEIISVAFTPRLPRPGKDKPHGTLAGFIADGEYEGVLFFKSPADKTRRGKPVLLNGNLHRADRNLTRLQATLRLVPPHHTRGKKPGKKRLVLQLKRKRKTKKYVLQWVGAVSDTALSSVCIIGHRGLGFAGLDNRPKALSRAWYFGASGIEFDITVPYQYSWTTNGEPSRIPLLNRLMVYHPPLLNQTCDIDSIPAEFSSLKDILEELQTYSVPFVYVDPKLTWLSMNNLKQVLKNITRFAHLLLRRGSSVIVNIAASDDRSGKFLSRSEAFQSSPYFATSQLSWTLEWTEVDKARDILARAKKHPTALSFNLTKIDGSLKWPLIEWLFKDVSKRDEKTIQNKSQILVFWTANDDDHFRGSLGVARDRERMGRSGEPGEIGIMTDAPHRLAYWLATQRKHK
ncbi:MAG: hypothetical protein V3V07_00945 [candidate division NC10 bacterium]